MGEYLELRSTLSNEEIRDYLTQQLPATLAARLEVADQRVLTKLATGCHVHTTFEEMVALYELGENGPFELGLSHEYNATPEEILSTWASLYLGPWNELHSKKPTALIPRAFGEELEHSSVWRRTKKVQAKNGTWYHRKLRPDETDGGNGNPNGRRVPCPNDGRGFRAEKVGFAWDYEHNLGRDLYRCKPCGFLFNTGEYDTPQFAALAVSLRASAAKEDEQVANLDGGALLYHVLRQDQSGIGIDHVVDGAIARAEKDDALDAARYLVAVVDDYLDPLTLQDERAWPGCRHAPLTMDELEGFAQLYSGAYRFAHAREQ
jgi:hypothetical protein